MKTMDLEQMECVSGGWENTATCFVGIAGMVLAVAGAITGGVGIAGFAVSWLGGGSLGMMGCRRALSEAVHRR